MIYTRENITGIQFKCAAPDVYEILSYDSAKDTIHLKNTSTGWVDKEYSAVPDLINNLNSGKWTVLNQTVSINYEIY